MSRDDAFEAWRRLAADADILAIATSARVGAKLRKRSREWIGPCPRCGGKDRFGINPAKQVFNCRGAGGGGVISLVMHACAVEFLAACEIITGEPPPGAGTAMTAEQRAKAEQLKQEAAERERRREQDENLYRARERRTVFDIFDNAYPLAGSSAEQYLALRGLTFPPTADGRAERLKCVESMPYYVDKDIIHRGPAMVAPIVDSAHKFRGLHITYLDLAQPKGKLQLEDPAGEPGALLDAKKSRGSKQGNFINLIGPAEPQRLVLGEGIEKLIAVHMALEHSARTASSSEVRDAVRLETTAFWSAADLGNLGGKAKGTVPHPTLTTDRGRPQKVPGVEPDMSAPAIEIPDSATDLMLLGDSTSDPFTTQCAIARACARYARPGRTVRVAWAPWGIDFDDLLRDARGDEAATAAALETIARILDAAPAYSGEIGAPVRDAAGEARQGGADSQRAAGTAAPNVLPFPARAGAAAPGQPSPSFSSSPSSPVPSLGQESTETLANDKEGGDEPPGEQGPTEEDFRYCAGLDQSDVDNAKRLIVYFGRDLLVRQEDDVAAGQWLAWTGTHWDLAGGDALAHLFGQRVGDLIKQEARYIDFTSPEARVVTAGDAAAKELKDLDPDTSDSAKLALIEELTAKVAAAKKARSALASRKTGRRKWGVATKNRARISAMLECAAPHLRRHPDSFNADQLKVATLTHTLAFVAVSDPENPDQDGDRIWIDPVTRRPRYRLVALRGHDRADLLTAVVPFPYDPKAACRDFASFLDLFQPAADKRRTVQQYSGMSLTAQPVQRIMFHTGTGGNGKSVFLEVVSRVLGDGLAVGVPAESVSGVVQNNPSAPTPDIARCYAKRFLRIAELPKDAPLKQETIKKLTGGERWPVRTMYKGYFEFRPTAKPHMSGNGEPTIDGTDGGLKRRLILLPWSVTLPPERQRDFEEVVSEIVAEGSGILNWLIAGALDFLNNGLVISDDVQAATADYFKDMDPCEQFIAAHVRPDPEGPGVQSRLMYEAYKVWSEVNGKAHMRETRFGKIMKKKITRDDTKRIHFYVGVALHDVPESPSAQQHPNAPPRGGGDDDIRF